MSSEQARAAAVFLMYAFGTFTLWRSRLDVARAEVEPSGMVGSPDSSLALMALAKTMFPMSPADEGALTKLARPYEVLDLAGAGKDFDGESREQSLRRSYAVFAAAERTFCSKAQLHALGLVLGEDRLAKLARHLLLADGWSYPAFEKAFPHAVGDVARWSYYEDYWFELALPVPRPRWEVTKPD